MQKIVIPLLETNLEHILHAIGKNHYCWSILSIWAVYKSDQDCDIADLERATEAERGYKLAWNVLTQLSQQLEQTHQLTLIGVGLENQLLARETPIDELIDKSQILVEAVDSSQWEIYVKDDAIASRLSQHKAQ